MTSRGLMVVASAALLMVQWAVPASAQLANCRADRDKFCPEIRLGGGRVLRCLEAHRAELSEPCKKELGGSGAAGGASNDPVKQACRGDVMKFCREAVGDQAKTKSCMQAHASELSDGCKTAMIAHGK